MILCRFCIKKNSEIKYQISKFIALYYCQFSDFDRTILINEYVGKYDVVMSKYVS